MSFVYTYLVLGFIYAMYIWLFAGDPWWALPFNTLGGPIIFIVETVRAFRRKKTLPQMFESKKAVIFDLDGTIIDSQPFKNQAMENVLESIDAGWVYRSYPHGLNEIEKWDHILKTEREIETKFTIKELADHTKAEYLKLHQEVHPLEGFWPFLHFLKNVKKMKVGLATNSDKDSTMTILKRMGAEELFDFVIGGDEVKHRKPHPEIYRTAAKALGYKPKDVVVFEDTIVGATAAHRAGMDVVVIWDGEEEDRDDFPPHLFGFMPDYEELDFILEKPYLERLKEGVELMKETGELDA